MNQYHCTEYRNDIVTVYPIPMGELSHLIPFNVRKPATTVAELGIDNLSKFLANRKCFSIIGNETLEEAGQLFRIEEKCTLKATPQKSIIGYTYTVNMQLKTEYSTPLLKEYLYSLVPTEHDFIVQTADGNYHFIRCPENAYKCSPEDNISESYQTTITFELKNINGLQPLSD